MQYYIAVGAEQRGPFSLDQLGGQPLGPETPVWNNALSDWTPAAYVPELAALLGLSASPAPPITRRTPLGAAQSGLTAHQSHSRCGIASIVLAIVGGITLVATLFVARQIAESNPQFTKDDVPPGLVTVGFATIGSIAAHFLGAWLGLAGMCEVTRKRLFAVLGTGFNLLALLFIGLIVAIGLSQGSRRSAIDLPARVADGRLAADSSLSLAQPVLGGPRESRSWR